VITLDRPAALNALDHGLKGELLAAIGEVARDPEVRVVVLTGAGRAFCAGQDLKEPVERLSGSYAAEVRQFYNPIVTALRRLEKPVVAAVNGVAAGAGASLALACDLRIAAESASFLFTFGRVGLVPDTGATWFLPRLVGLGRAMELLLTGEALTAARALEWGLVNRVVPDESLMAEATALAETLAAAAPRALALTKRALARSLELGLEAALDHEAWLQGVAGRTEDHREGLAAFLEKRPPIFRGR
jgi:2-(1,2-epoxy-1,2-dihydrophenyl)acetyl-CoA isomerase